MHWLTTIAYGAPALGTAFYLFFIQFYFLKFSTDVLLAPPAIMGLLFGLGRVWDALTDPLVGYWSDRTRTRIGRRRPWMLASIPLLCVFSLMVWSPPVSVTGGALIAWIAVALLGFYAAYTCYSIPHASLGPEMSLDHHERSRVFGVYRVAFVLGMMMAFVGIGYAADHEDPRGAAITVATVAAVAATVLLLVPLPFLTEREEFAGRAARSPWSALSDVWDNSHARVLLAAWFAEGLGGGALGVLAPYLAEYVLERPDLIAVIPAFYIIASVVSIPAWILLSRKYGKRRVWRCSLVGAAFCFSLTLLVQPGQLGLLALVLVGAGFTNGCGGTIGASMLADCIDFDEWRTGERKEGAYSAAWGFAIKASIACVIVGTGVALQLSGFIPNARQTPTALWTLRGLFAGLPVISATLAFFLLRGFSLDEAEHRRIRLELDQRQEPTSIASNRSEPGSLPQPVARETS